MEIKTDSRAQVCGVLEKLRLYLGAQAGVRLDHSRGFRLARMHSVGAGGKLWCLKLARARFVTQKSVPERLLMFAKASGKAKAIAFARSL